MYMKIFEPQEVKFESYSFTCSDGGQTHLWICIDPKPENSKRVILIHHGLAKGTTKYVK